MGGNNAAAYCPFRSGSRFHLPGMVKFRLPRRAIARAKSVHYRCGNHAWLAAGAHYTHYVSIDKTLIESEPVKFYENSRRNRVDFAQKPRFIANDSFKPVC
jgi:hypothetical protein